MTGRVSSQRTLTLLVVLAALALTSCVGVVVPTPSPTASPQVSSPASGPLARVPGIVDPTNLGWPRVVQGLNGRIVILVKPQRIVTLSVGHDELTYALVPTGRVVGVGSSTKEPLYSNVAALTKDVPLISREPETILSKDPDVMVSSPYLPADLVATLTRAGLPVVKTDLSNAPEDRINQVLLLGYIYGEEERGIAFAQELRARLGAVRAVVDAVPLAARPRVLPLTFYGDKVYTAGKTSTEGGIIAAAGGINPAEEQGLRGNPVITLEGVIAMRPDVIIVPQPGEGAVRFRESLLGNAALAEVPAVRDRKVYIVDNRRFTTLSHYNILGTEELARMLWPKELGGLEVRAFSVPG